MTEPTAGKGEVFLPHTLKHLLSEMLALYAATGAEAVAPCPHGQAEAQGGSATRLSSVPRCLEETPSRKVHSEQRSQPVSEKPLPCALGGVCPPLSSLGGTFCFRLQVHDAFLPSYQSEWGWEGAIWNQDPASPRLAPVPLCCPLSPQFSGPFCYFHKTWLQTQVTMVFLWHGGHAVSKATTSVIHSWGFLGLQVEWNVGTSH